MCNPCSRCSCPCFFGFQGGAYTFYPHPSAGREISPSRTNDRLSSNMTRSHKLDIHSLRTDVYSTVKAPHQFRVILAVLTPEKRVIKSPMKTNRCSESAKCFLGPGAPGRWRAIIFLEQGSNAPIGYRPTTVISTTHNHWPIPSSLHARHPQCWEGSRVADD